MKNISIFSIFYASSKSLKTNVLLDNKKENLGKKGTFKNILIHLEFYSLITAK